MLNKQFYYFGHDTKGCQGPSRKSANINSNSGDEIDRFPDPRSPEIFSAEGKHPCQLSEFDKLEADRERLLILTGMATLLQTGSCASRSPTPSLQPCGIWKLECGNSGKDKGQLLRAGLCGDFSPLCGQRILLYRAFPLSLKLLAEYFRVYLGAADFQPQGESTIKRTDIASTNNNRIYNKLPLPSRHFYP
ncbi:hypothetical protein [Nitrosospira multiformis]|uniref:hypothetical protein n=1 Tax=Nitrosospira multiformis TaxID=1231 RepID=UPI0011141AC9|nr:hypothetical protein [Nitrosospira multiformis]